MEKHLSQLYIPILPIPAYQRTPIFSMIANTLNQERSKEQRCLRFPTKSGTSVRPEQLDKDKTHDFVRRRLPIVFKARGNPWHFLTIFIPISFCSAFNSGLSSWNAYVDGNFFDTLLPDPDSSPTTITSFKPRSPLSFERISRLSRTDRKYIKEIPHLARSGLRFSFHLAFQGFIVYFIQEILNIKHSIFDLKKPVSDRWILNLLLFCIINHSIDGQKFHLQLVQHPLVELSMTKVVQNKARSEPIKYHIKWSTDNQFCWHGHAKSKDWRKIVHIKNV
ncbi:hypothetical protein CR513_04217, partial [Mucuna pruriens]